jgi:hypothetical protein
VLACGGGGCRGQISISGSSFAEAGISSVQIAMLGARPWPSSRKPRRKVMNCGRAELCA